MVMVKGPGDAVVSPPTSAMPVSSCSARSPEAKPSNQAGEVSRGSASDKQIGVAARALGGEVGEIDRKGLVADRVRRIVGEKMHALDQACRRWRSAHSPPTTSSTAASSRRPSAALSVASGAK